MRVYFIVILVKVVIKMYKYYLIYKTNKIHVKSFKESDDMFRYLFKLKLKNMYNSKFKYKVVFGDELSFINVFVDDLFEGYFNQHIEDILEYTKGN